MGGLDFDFDVRFDLYLALGALGSARAPLRSFRTLLACRPIILLATLPAAGTLGALLPFGLLGLFRPLRSFGRLGPLSALATRLAFRT
ncbi:MAG: hypothetical protein ACJA2W_003362, partial [Planctomycetota bacterium]